MQAEYGLMLSAIFFGCALVGLLTAPRSEALPAPRLLHAAVVSPDGSADQARGSGAPLLPTAATAASAMGEGSRLDPLLLDHLRQERDRLARQVEAARRRLATLDATAGIPGPLPILPDR